MTNKATKESESINYVHVKGGRGQIERAEQGDGSTEQG